MAAVRVAVRLRVWLAVQVVVVLAKQVRQVAQGQQRKDTLAAQAHQRVLVRKQVAVVVVLVRSELRVRCWVSAAQVAQVSRQASQVRRSLVLVAVVVVAGIMSLIVDWAVQAAVATAQAHLLSLLTVHRTQVAAVAAAVMTAWLVQVATAVRVSSSSVI